MKSELTTPDLEATDPDCMDAELAAELLRPTPWQSMVVVGDSVAAGVRQPLDGYRDECFANRVGETLAATREGFRFRNLGMRDLRLQEIIGTQLAAAVDFRPDMAMVVAGGNDVLGKQFDPTYVRERLELLLDELAAAGADVITIGLFDLPRSGLVPPEFRETLIQRFDELDRITAEAVAAVDGLHIDTHHHARAADPGIFADDRIHANSRGHAIAFAAIVEQISGSGRW